MATCEQPQIQEEVDFFNDEPQKAKEETPKTSQLVVDTKLKQAEVQHAPISASTAGTAQTQSVHVSEKVVVEKVTSSNVAEVRSELHNLHNKIDTILGRNRSLSPTIFHKVSYKTSAPVETIKKSYGLNNVPLTTSTWSTASSLGVNKRDASLDSIESVALKARAVARAKEYLLGVNGKKKTTTYESKSIYDSSSSLSASKYFYSKPVDLNLSSSALHKSSTITSIVEVPRYIITETHTAYREKVIPVEVPTYKTYTFYKPAKLETVYQYQPEKERLVYTPSTYSSTSYKPLSYSSIYSTSAYEVPKSSSIRTEKFRSSAAEIVDVKNSSCHYCGNEINQKQATSNNREEREVKSRAPQVEEQEAKNAGKRREILDDRKQRNSEFVRKTPYEQSNRDQVSKQRAQEILKQDEQNIRDFDFNKNRSSVGGIAQATYH